MARVVGAAVVGAAVVGVAVVAVVGVTVVGVVRGGRVVVVAGDVVGVGRVVVVADDVVAGAGPAVAMVVDVLRPGLTVVDAAVALVGVVVVDWRGSVLVVAPRATVVVGPGRRGARVVVVAAIVVVVCGIAATSIRPVVLVAASTGAAPVVADGGGGATDELEVSPAVSADTSGAPAVVLGFGAWSAVSIDVRAGTPSPSGPAMASETTTTRAISTPHPAAAITRNLASSLSLVSRIEVNLVPTDAPVSEPSAGTAISLARPSPGPLLRSKAAAHPSHSARWRRSRPSSSASSEPTAQPS